MDTGGLQDGRQDEEQEEDERGGSAADDGQSSFLAFYTPQLFFLESEPRMSIRGVSIFSQSKEGFQKIRKIQGYDIDIPMPAQCSV